MEQTILNLRIARIMDAIETMCSQGFNNTYLYLELDKYFYEKTGEKIKSLVKYGRMKAETKEYFIHLISKDPSFLKVMELGLNLTPVSQKNDK